LFGTRNKEAKKEVKKEQGHKEQGTMLLLLLPGAAASFSTDFLGPGTRPQT
jgi:hypothetical protein